MSGTNQPSPKFSQKKKKLYQVQQIHIGISHYVHK